MMGLLLCEGGNGNVLPLRDAIYPSLSSGESLQDTSLEYGDIEVMILKLLL